MRKRTYNIARVLQLQGKITQDTELAVFVDDVLTGDTFDEFVLRVRSLLPLEPPLDLVRESLLHLVGVKLTDDSLEEEAWRLAGNIHRFRAGLSILPWNRQIEDEMVPVQILAGVRDFDSRRRSGAHFEFQILAGTSCPMRVTKFWTTSFCGFISQRVGFSKPWGDYPFRDVLQFVNLRMYVEIEVDKSGVSPDFVKVWEKDERIYPPACVRWNREFMRARKRGSRRNRCPRNFPADHQCHLCIVGQDECLAAVHDVTYVKRFCDECLKDGWFDPAVRSEMCLECERKSKYGRRN